MNKLYLASINQYKFLVCKRTPRYRCEGLNHHCGYVAPYMNEGDENCISLALAPQGKINFYLN